MHFLRISMVFITQLSSRAERKKHLRLLKEAGIFPMKPLKEAVLKQAYVTTRTDLIGKTYDYLVMHSTTGLGYCALRLWYVLYIGVKKIAAVAVEGK